MASSGFGTGAVIVAGSHRCYLEDIVLQALLRKIIYKNLLRVELIVVFTVKEK